jgi:glycerol-3-phosphate dehydrogenase (NAD(P)+)
MSRGALVLGGGAFGTSIASILSNNFTNVSIKVRSQDVYDSIKNRHENSVYLAGLPLATNISAALEWEEIDLSQIEIIISGLPTAAITPFFSEHRDKITPLLARGVPLVSLSKGIDPETLELPDDLLLSFFSTYKDNLTYLSGPSFAHEIMKEQITVVSLAGRSKRVLETVCQMMATDYFRLLPNYDVKGVLLGGALKNILAIAGGIIEGLGYNHNTRAAMITRGIAEMLRFGKVFNARPETFYGMSGMGDLILTSTGDLSRNKVFGLKIAQGERPQDIISSQRSVVEGYKTAKAAYKLSQEYDIHARIFRGVYAVLYEGLDVEQAIKSIVTAPMKFELD